MPWLHLSLEGHDHTRLENNDLDLEIVELYEEDKDHGINESS